MHPLRLLFVVAACSLFTVLACATTITSVTFTGGPTDPTITLTGTGFNPEPPANVSSYGPYTVDDYGNALYLNDTTYDHLAFTAGQTGDAIGLTILLYTDDTITYMLGPAYAFFYTDSSYLLQLNSGDPFTAVVNDASYNGEVSYSAVPEPGSVWMIVLGFTLLGIAVLRTNLSLFRPV